MLTASAHPGPIPQGKYLAATRQGDIIYSAGMTPRQAGHLIMAEQVALDKPLEYYREAVRLAAANALTALQNTLLDNELLKILTMHVYINAQAGYTEHSKLADFASEFLFEQLGDAGICSRVALGVASLPGNAPLEIQLIAAIK